MRPVITFTTDFGHTDPFVGVMKGVALGIAPSVALVDLVHQIEPQNILQAACVLQASYSYFPKKTVHLAVVDPGVGSARRPIAVQTRDYTFVAPDNGILSFVFHDESCRVYELTKPEYFLAPVSATFHGRDIFAPAAAWIAKGTRLSAMGKKIDDPVVLDLPQPSLQGGALKGEIIYIDRFGNLTSNISAEVLRRNFPHAEAFQVKIGSGRIAGLADCYSQCQKGEMGCILNSWDRLEIFRREGSAARRLKTRIGAAVTVTANRPRK